MLIPTEEGKVEERYGATENFAKTFAKSISECQKTKDYEIIDDLIFEAILLTIQNSVKRLTVEECAGYSRVIRAILPKEALTRILTDHL